MNRNAPDAAVPRVPSPHEVFTPRFFNDIRSDARDAARYRQLRKGLPLTVVCPAPTKKKPDGKVTVIYGPNTEAAWGESLDRALDAVIDGVTAQTREPK